MIDYSNGYPVQITSNVNANTPWKEVFAMNPTKVISLIGIFISKIILHGKK